VHKKIYARKAEWFQLMTNQHFVMWWVPEGHRPNLAEAAERLSVLRENGSSDDAFGWDYLPNVTLWQSQRCA